jgi:hypothetical protein
MADENTTLAAALRAAPAEGVPEPTVEEEGLDLALGELFASFKSGDEKSFKDTLKAVLLLSKE